MTSCLQFRYFGPCVVRIRYLEDVWMKFEERDVHMQRLYMANLKKINLWTWHKPYELKEKWMLRIGRNMQIRSQCLRMVKTKMHDNTCFLMEKIWSQNFMHKTSLHLDNKKRRCSQPSSIHQQEIYGYREKLNFGPMDMLQGFINSKKSSCRDGRTKSQTRAISNNNVEFFRNGVTGTIRWTARNIIIQQFGWSKNLDSRVKIGGLIEENQHSVSMQSRACENRKPP